MLKLKRIKGKIKTSYKAYKFGIFNFRQLISFLKVAPNESDLENTPQMTVFEAKELLNQGTLFIIDVRGKKDYENGHLDGSVHSSLFTVLETLEMLPKDKTIGVLCYGGGASNTVTQMLIDKGITNVKNIKGGIIRYALDVDESMLGKL